MKKWIKSFLIQKDWYHAVRYSRFFGLYSFMFKPEERAQQKKELNFYKSFLKNCSLIFDIGANDGHKTVAFLNLADKVVAVDPDKANITILNARFKRQKKRVFVEKYAVSSAKGQQFMFIYKPGAAFNTLSEKFRNICQQQSEETFKEKIAYNSKVEVTTTTLDELIEKYGTPYFIKVDTEGYELEVLRGLHHPVPFMSLEFMLPEFSVELKQSLQLLEERFPSGLIYNLAIDEKLVFTSFINRSVLEQYLNEGNKMVIELIVHNEKAIPVS